MIKYKIVEVSPEQHSIVVRFYSDVVTEAAMAVQWDEAGKILRGRTDYSIDLPIPAPTGEALVTFISGHAPTEWLETQAQVLNPSVDTSLGAISSLLGVETLAEAPAEIGNGDVPQIAVNSVVL
jgi:hypothetical protein